MAKNEAQEICKECFSVSGSGIDMRANSNRKGADSRLCPCASAHDPEMVNILMDRRQHSPLLRLLTAQELLPIPVLRMAQRHNLCIVRAALVRAVIRFEYRNRHRRRPLTS